MSGLRWVGSWATSPALTEPENEPPDPPGLSGNTLRQLVYPTLGGRRVRLHLSNEYGRAPLEIRRVHLARARSAGAVDTTTDAALTFAGSPSIAVPAGRTCVSDPLDYALGALTPLAISVHFGATPEAVTGHPGSRTTSYVSLGDALSAATPPSPFTTDHWYFITGIDVEADARAAAVVALGDSITDGRGSTTNRNERWPDYLARRLQAHPATSRIAVLNQGVGGNTVLSGGKGPTALQRFERDVLGMSGVRWLIVLEGVNDIGDGGRSAARDLIAAYERFIELAHAENVLVYGVPILPFGGSDYDRADHEAARATVNDWIRTSGAFDGVIDLDAAVRDPENPRALLPAYDSGDRLHPSPAGYARMAAAVDLALFR